MPERDAPIFIKLEEHNDIISIVEVIKAKLSESKDTLLRISELKEEEEAELLAWNRNLEDIAKKLGYVDEILTQPKF